MHPALTTTLRRYVGKGKGLYRILSHPRLLLMVFSDRLSTHNIVHDSLIQGKGEFIAAQTLFMYHKVLQLPFPTHLVASGRMIYNFVSEDDRDPYLHRRAFIVRDASKPKVEHVVRRYLTGSLYKAIQQDGTDPYGYGLARELPLMHRFDDPLSTPTCKTEYDEPLIASAVRDEYPAETEMAEQAFDSAEAYLAGQGIALVDAKLELYEGVIIDDWFNGDCTRMTLAGSIKEGVEPPFLDKEIFRSIAKKKWDGGPQAPLTFSESEQKEGLKGYEQALEIMTGATLASFRRTYFDA